jgi:MFS family permease
LSTSSASDSTGMSPLAPGETAPAMPDARHNAAALIGDMSMFQLGVNFIAATTVLPAMVSDLGGSAMMVGLATGLTSGAWLLPQILVAGPVARLDYKKPLMVKAVWVSRPLLLVLAFILWRWGATAPAVALAATFVIMSLLWGFGGVVAVPWYDIMARVVSPRRRGYVMGTSQILGSLGGIGAGLFVRYVLSDASPWDFPSNYALLHVIAAVFLFLSAISIMSIREPAPEPGPKREVLPTRTLLATLPRLLWADRPFFRLVVVRMLAGFIGISGSFYVLYATQEMGLALSNTGLFVSTQVVGAMVAGIMMSVIQDRWGPRPHVALICALAAVPALLALAAAPLYQVVGSSILYLYLLIYFLQGLSLNAIGFPFMNYILEYTPSDRRTLYVGTTNTLSAISMLAPALGGWLIDAVSYPAVFVASFLFAAAATLLALTLPTTRARPPA